MSGYSGGQPWRWMMETLRARKLLLRQNCCAAKKHADLTICHLNFGKPFATPAPLHVGGPSYFVIKFFFHTPFCSRPVCPPGSLLHQALTHPRTLLSQVGSSPAAPARRSPNGISVPSEESMGTAGSSSSMLACARRPAKEASAIHRFCSERLVASAAHGARCLALARANRRRNADAPLLIRPPTSMPSTTKRHLTRPAAPRPRVQGTCGVCAPWPAATPAPEFASSVL